MDADLKDILARLEQEACPANLAGMARYGIDTANALGVNMPFLRQLARQYRKRHDLALELWGTGVREARLIAAMIDDPIQVTSEQMDAWAQDLTSWDLCDGLCSELLRKTPYAYAKIEQWSVREEEFVKRAAFTLMATLAVHDKAAGDETFMALLPIIERESTDERNGVKKAVNWALRQIGKRNLALNAAAVECAGRIREGNSRAARWIAADVLRELTAETTLQRLRSKEKRDETGKR